MDKGQFPSVQNLGSWKYPGAESCFKSCSGCLLLLNILITVQVFVELFQENSRQSNYSLVAKSPPCIFVGYLIFPVMEPVFESLLVVEFL